MIFSLIKLIKQGNVIILLFSWHSQLYQLQPSWVPCCRVIREYSSSSCFFGPTCPSSEPIALPRASCKHCPNTLVSLFSCYKMHLYPTSIPQPAFSLSFSIQSPSVSSPQPAWPDILASAFSVPRLSSSSFLLPPFIFWAGSQYASSSCRLKVWFVPFGP